MPKLLLVPALLAVFLCGWVPYVCAAPDPNAPDLQQNIASDSEPPVQLAPVVELPETTHDLGAVQSGQPCEYSFTVRNKGTALLEIRKVAVG